MTAESLQTRLQNLRHEPLPHPGRGATAARHAHLFEVGREDLTLAKLAEAHWDALSILAEAGHASVPGMLYAVWASEIPGQPLCLEAAADGRFSITGTKPFTSGAGLVDRALLTVSSPEPRLVDLDLRRNGARVQSDTSAWSSPAFALTRTGAVTLDGAELLASDLVGEPGFYLDRPGFWHGACGPAACWAGGAAGLLDYALTTRRADPHTLAHLAAMHSNVWGLRSLLATAGHEIDAAPDDRAAAHQRALTLRHLVEQLATDTLHRFARALGPQPLAMNPAIARRYQELDIFLRQCHAERDLEALGRALRT